MPITKVKTPNGIVSVRHPEGATQEQIFGFSKQQMSQDFSASEMVGNIPGSGMQFLKDITYPVRHPIDTAKAMGGLAAGSASLLSEQFGKSFPGLQQYEKYPQQMGEFIGNRYGSVDAAMNTLQNDPVGVLADVSGLLMGGGAIAAKLSGIAGKTGRVAQKAGLLADPINASVVTPMKAVAKGVSKIGPDPRSLYESSVKFSTTLPKAQREAMAATALRHGIMPTGKGVDKMQRLMGNLDTKINGLIDDATQAGVQIPKDAVFNRLKDARKSVGGPKIEAADDLAQINAIAKSFDEQMKSLGRDYLTPNELQAFKQDAYRRINFDAKNMRSGIGRDIARKSMARGAKEAIEQVADVKDLNRQYGDLLKLSDPLQRSAARIENRNLISINTPLNVIGGAAVGGNTGVVAGAIASLFESPRAKARVAIAMQRAKEGKALNVLDQSLLRTAVQQGLLQGGRIGQY